MDPMNLQAAMSAIEQSILSAKPADCPALAGKLEQLKVMLLARIMNGHGNTAFQSVMSEGDLMTIPEVAVQLKLSVYRTYELARQGKLQTVKIGKSVRVPQAAVAEFLSRLNDGRAA